MAFFSQANLEAVGGRDKIRLCPKCGVSLEYIAERGYCCPRGHGGWWPKEELTPPNYYACQGSTYKKGSNGKGQKRKKKPKKQQWAGIYGDS